MKALLIVMAMSDLTGQVATSRVALYDTLHDCHERLETSSKTHGGHLSWTDNDNLTVAMTVDQHVQYGVCRLLDDTTETTSTK